MRDFQRLREQLIRALCVGPLALAIPACGPATPAPTPTTVGNEAPGGTEPAKPKVADTPWPQPEHGCGSYGEWCGPTSQVAAAGGDTGGGARCATSFAHADLYYDLDEEATRARRADGDTETCCYTYNDGCIIGRPLLEEGRARVAPVRDGGAWSAGDVAPAGALPPGLRDALARGWLEDALLEHVSVASFARATLELMAVGAPPELLAACQRAGLDEVRHAEGCFRLAERYAGRRVSPGALPALAPRAPDLVRLAVDTFVEGCVAETVATLAASRLVARCEDAEVARLLRRIVRDETRHAALAWQTVAWAAREGGAAVAAALRARAAELAPAPGHAAGAPADPALVAHGRLDEATRRAAVEDAWREIILPTLDAVLVSCAA